MAKKKRRKRRWLRLLLIFVVTPVAIWAAAFLVWLNWQDSPRPTRSGAPSARSDARAQAGKTEPPVGEKIAEEDRRRLDEILKRRE